MKLVAIGLVFLLAVVSLSGAEDQFIDVDGPNLPEASLPSLPNPPPVDVSGGAFVESEASLQETGNPQLYAVTPVTKVKPHDKCHPRCRWQCDDPDCPSICRPVCTPPECQIQCKYGPCADCKINCQEPDCTVRCPKDVCEKGDCPKCETICSQAKCRVDCIPPEPVCAPVCATTQCKLNCEKPNDCPRPKCQLVCEKVHCSVGQSPWSPKAQSECCRCSLATLRLAMIKADGLHLEKQLKHIRSIKDNIRERILSSHAWAHRPRSLLEVLNTVSHDRQLGKKEMCCPCTKTPLPPKKARIPPLYKPLKKI